MLSRARLFERAAWTYAAGGRSRDTERALDQAREALAEPGDQPGPAWTAWIDDTELQIMTGRCRAILSDSSDAITPLTQALAGFPDAYARDKALYSLALARAHIAAGEIDQGADIVIRAAELAAGVRSKRPSVHLAHTVSLLDSHTRQPAVAQMRERLASLRQLSLVD